VKGQDLFCCIHLDLSDFLIYSGLRLELSLSLLQKYLTVFLDNPSIFKPMMDGLRNTMEDMSE
jgi:hypothetical protein